MSLLTTLKSKKRFTPRDNSNLIIWLDATDINTISETSGAVSEWRDKSGKENHFSQATGADQPILYSSGINNRPSVKFEDSGDTLSTTTTFDNQAPYTIFIVHEPTNLSGGIFFQNRFLSTDDRIGRCIGTGTNTLFTYYGDTEISQANAIFNDVPLVLTLKSEGGASSVVAESYADGASIGSTSSATISQLDAVLDFKGGGTGYFGEFIMYNRSLGDNERSSVESYLINKWGVPIS